MNNELRDKMIKSKKGLAAVDIVAIIGILAILAAIIIACVAGITNNKNKNKEPDTNNATTSTRLVKGEVVNKCCTIKNNTHQYKFELEGEKDEIMVRYWLEVSEQDYNSYRIGDYYRL